MLPAGSTATPVAYSRPLLPMRVSHRHFPAGSNFATKASPRPSARNPAHAPSPKLRSDSMPPTITMLPEGSTATLVVGGPFGDSGDCLFHEHSLLAPVPPVPPELLVLPALPALPVPPAPPVKSVGGSVGTHPSESPVTAAYE